MTLQPDNYTSITCILGVKLTYYAHFSASEIIGYMPYFYRYGVIIDKQYFRQYNFIAFCS